MTTLRIPAPSTAQRAAIARETDANLIDLATVARCRAEARREVERCEAFHRGETGNLVYGTSYSLTVREAEALAFAAMAALGVEDALDSTGHPYRSAYPLGAPYSERPNVKVGPYVSDAVRHVLRDREGVTAGDRDLVSRLAVLANVSFRLIDRS